MIDYLIRPGIYVASVHSLPELISNRFSNILLLTSPTIYGYLKSTGLVDTLVNQNSQIFSSIKPNAHLSQLEQIMRSFDKPSAIIAIGGGSVLDSAKALSVTWGNTSIYDYFYKKAEISSRKIFTIAIPTTAGTGAELSYGAILEDVNQKLKGGLRGEIIQPDEVVIDIDLYKLAPSRLISETGFDCLTHAIETYLSTNSSPLVRYQSIAAINTVLTYLPLAVKQKDSHSMMNMALASCMMGINLAKSTTCLPHRIQYVIGPRTDTSHAQGLVMLYKGWLPVISKTMIFKNLAKDLGLSEKKLIEKITILKKELNLTYSLKEYGITDKDVKDIAAKVTGNVANDPSFNGVKTIEEIIKNSL